MLLVLRVCFCRSWLIDCIVSRSINEAGFTLTVGWHALRLLNRLHLLCLLLQLLILFKLRHRQLLVNFCLSRLVLVFFNLFVIVQLKSTFPLHEGLEL